MFLAGCDANQRRAAALRNGCRFRQPHTISQAHIPKDAFVTTAELVRLAQSLARTLAGDKFDAIIGIARSGLIAAAAMAVELHIPLFSFSPVSKSLHPLGSGFRLGDTGHAKPRAALLVDDTVSNGGTLQKSRDTIREIPVAATAAILVNPDRRDAVDFAAATYPQPHYLEWCFANTFWARDMGFDFDGILCRDPQAYDTDQAYSRFLAAASPLYLPRMFPINIISARCEWTRQKSLEWLSRHRVRAQNLILWGGDPESRWAEPDRVARWKAQQIREIRQASGIAIYAESDPRQASIIAAEADIAVLCPAAGKVFNVERHSLS